MKLLWLKLSNDEIIVVLSLKNRTMLNLKNGMHGLKTKDKNEILWKSDSIT